MKGKKLQSLKDELFSSEEILSDEMKELIEVIGGEKPATHKGDDCSVDKPEPPYASDFNYEKNKPTKWRTDSGNPEMNDTVRGDDGCNATVQQAAQDILNAVDNYNLVCNGVVSGDLMNEDD